MLNIKKILLPVDFPDTSLPVIFQAATMGRHFGAEIVVLHVAEALVGDASRRIAELQQRLGIKAEVFIGSGDVPKVLSQAAKQTNADLLVTGSFPILVTCAPTVTPLFALSQFRFCTFNDQH